MFYWMSETLLTPALFVTFRGNPTADANLYRQGTITPSHGQMVEADMADTEVFMGGLEPRARQVVYCAGQFYTLSTAKAISY